MADVEAADCGNSQCCSEDFEHTSALRSLHSVHAEASQPLQTNQVCISRPSCVSGQSHESYGHDFADGLAACPQDVTTDYGPWSVHQSGLDSVQLHTLLNQKVE